MHDLVFGYLQLKTLGRQSIASEHRRHTTKHITALHPVAGHVDRNGLQRIARINPAPQLSAGLIEHVLINIAHQTGVARDRQKLVGSYQPLGWMLPAYQRFEADKAVTAQVLLQLVIHTQLVVSDRFVQVGFQTQAATRQFGQLLGVEGITVAPPLLGQRHGRVGIFQQLCSIPTILRKQRQTDTGAHV